MNDRSVVTSSPGVTIFDDLLSYSGGAPTEPSSSENNAGFFFLNKEWIQFLPDTSIEKKKFLAKIKKHVPEIIAMCRAVRVCSSASKKRYQRSVGVCCQC